MDQLTSGRLAAAALALAFLAGAVGFVIGNRSSAPARPERDSAEVSFLYDMIGHHEQALEMSSLELTNGSAPRVLHFAREIIQQQSYEVGVMQQLLRTWGFDPADDGRGHADMPGMASEQEMDQLADAQGRDADELFLRLMIAHHRGGAQMAAFASERTDEPQVDDLASRMARIQQLEIGEMTDAAETLGLDVGPRGSSSTKEHAGMEDAHH